MESGLTNDFLDIKSLHNQYREYTDNKSEEREQAQKYRRYDDGDQWDADQKQQLKDRGQPPTVYNQVRRKMNALVGIEEQVRQDPKAYGRNPGIDEKSADVATSCIRYVNDNNQFPILGKRSLRHGGVSGIGGVRFGLRKIRNQIEIEQEYVDPRFFFYDPASVRHDFSDAKYLGIAKYVSFDDLAEMFPKQKKLLDDIVSGDMGCEFASDDLPDEWLDLERRRAFTVEHHYYSAGEWRVAYWISGHILKQMVSPYRDDDGKSGHMFEMWTPYISDDNTRYGEVKDMISPQDGINKRSSKILHQLSVRQVLMKRGAVDDPEDARDELAKPDGVIELNRGFTVDDFQILNQNDQISGQIQLLQQDKQEMDRIGPNNALTGRGTEHQSGVAINAQKMSGMAEVSAVMQEFRSWKLRCYVKTWNLIRKYWPAPRVIRITDDEKSPNYIGLNQIEVVRDEEGELKLQFSNVLAQLDVDIILDEGPDTITLQDEDFQNLMNIAPALANTPSAIPPEALLKASRLRNKEELAKMIEENAAKNQPPPELQQQQMEMQMRKAEQDLAEQAAKTAKIESDAQLNIMKARQMEFDMETKAREQAAQAALMEAQPITQTVQ